MLALSGRPSIRSIPRPGASLSAAAHRDIASERRAL